MGAYKSRVTLSQRPKPRGGGRRTSVSTWTHGCLCHRQSRMHTSSNTALNSNTSHDGSYGLLVLASILFYTQRSTTHIILLTPLDSEELMFKTNFKKHIKRGAIAITAITKDFVCLLVQQRLYILTHQSSVLSKSKHTLTI